MCILRQFATHGLITAYDQLCVFESNQRTKLRQRCVHGRKAHIVGQKNAPNFKLYERLWYQQAFGYV